MDVFPKRYPTQEWSSVVYDCQEALFLRMWFQAAPLHTALSSSQSHHLTGFDFRSWCVAMRAIVSPTWSHDSKCAPSNLQRMITVLDHIGGGNFRISYAWCQSYWSTSYWMIDLVAESACCHEASQWHAIVRVSCVDNIDPSGS